MEPKKTMTAKERTALIDVIKLRGRVAKADIDKRAAALRADMERQLSAEFKAEDAEWSDLTRMAKEAAQAADAELARRCKALGIRESFRPRINVGFDYRGENASRERRAELRTLAVARIDAAAKDAKHSVEAWQAEAQTAILAGALQSEDATAFLANMPTAEALLPAPTLAQLDALATSPSLKLVNTATGTDA